MIQKAIFDPKSIVIVGASRDTGKIGGRILKNILDSGFSGNLYGINPKEQEIFGIACPNISELPECELAIICVPAKFCLAYVQELAEKHAVKGFIIVSAGFSEQDEAGAELQEQILDTINTHGCSLIGPNCTGILTPTYAGVFAGPIPDLLPGSCDFASGSGATAAFTLEQGILQGLPFSQVLSVGNSAQIGIEDILEYWDESYLDTQSSPVKMLYIETIRDAAKFLKHAASLTAKGCFLTAIKSGSSSAGKRAASSHTGALASSSDAVKALFRKAGVFYCQSREELINSASLALSGFPKGKRIGIVTHAGGPGVILTDTLSRYGFSIPEFSGESFDQLKAQLYPGSSVKNPVDFLATGTAEQLQNIVETIESASVVDAIAIIFGSPGLGTVDDIYRTIESVSETCSLPVYPVFPSPITASKEMKDFTQRSHIPFFTDEALFGKIIGKTFRQETAEEQIPYTEFSFSPKTIEHIRELTAKCDGGYLTPEICTKLLNAAGLPTPHEVITDSLDELLSFASSQDGAIVMKVVGSLHKSDVGGVALNISSPDDVRSQFTRMMAIPDTKAIQAQVMMSGTELYIGALKEDGFGHLVYCGLGGIYIEVLKDTVCGLAPLHRQDAGQMVKRLKGFKLFEGTRGKAPLPFYQYLDCIVKVSHLVNALPEIVELDINPLLADEKGIYAVDCRIRIMR